MRCAGGHSEEVAATEGKDRVVDEDVERAIDDVDAARATLPDDLIVPQNCFVADSSNYRRFAPLLEMLRTPACIFDDAGVVRYLNSAWLEYVEVTDHAADAVRWLQLIGEQDQECASAHLTIARRKSDGNAVSFECRLLDREGASRWHLLSLQPQNDSTGIESDWLCTATDVHHLVAPRCAVDERAQLQTDMLNASTDCIKLIALDGSLVHMNEAGCRALGVTAESGFGMQWVPLLPVNVRPDADLALANARAGSPFHFRGRTELPGRPVRLWDNVLTPVKDAAGRTTSILCVSREVTAERETQDKLRQSEERLALAARVGGMGIWDYDIANDTLHCDETWYRITGSDPGSPIESMADLRPLIHPDDVDRATEVESTAAELVASDRDYALEYRIVRPSGEIRWVRSAACLIKDLSDVATRAIGFVIDITDAKRDELALRQANRALSEVTTSLARQTLQDPLTGIANRRRLDLELARICAEVGTSGRPLTVGMVDVDYFKRYNDRYGHIEGDTTLRTIAATLQSVVRNTDIVARFGGEEFAVVLPDLADLPATLERLTAAVDDLRIRHEGSPFGRITISCGWVTFHATDTLAPAALLTACDQALYQAKAAGRNRHIIHVQHRDKP